MNERRRDLLKWIPPVVIAVSLPAHAQTSEVPPIEPPIDTCPPETWNGYSYKFDIKACTRENPVLCIERGITDCPAEYKIVFAKPVLPLRYTEATSGTIPAFTDCVDLGYLIPDSVDFDGKPYRIFEYCIQITQHPSHPNDTTVYCSNRESGRR